jgi:hypothetical protein
MVDCLAFVHDEYANIKKKRNLHLKILDHQHFSSPPEAQI